ncbi:MAG TPA: glycosyltransferase family 4 protein [Dehalococcoidia bacterium]|nr:glycosyltransferase family 4 protein [Dehalococcoidia bacterium]
MKIALVSPYDFAVPGGVNSHIQRLAAELRGHGHQVRIIAPSSDHALEKQDDFIIIGHHPIGLPAGGSVARVTLSLTLAGTVRRVLEREAFDIVHLHEPLVPILPVQFLRYSEAINIATFHATKDRGSILYHYGRPLARRWLRRLHGRVCVSPAALRMVSRYFPGYYTIIPNGIDPARFSSQVSPLPQYCDGKLNILFVGRLEKRKGLKYLLGAYRLAKEAMPAIRLLIAGPDGGQRAHLESYVRQVGLEDVVFVGFVPEEELPRYYRTAHICSSPATGNESFGIVLLEAMAAGKPVVASNIEGYAYVVTEGVEGLLVRPRDEGALAQALLRLLADEDLRSSLGRQGQRRAEEFAWDRIAKQVLALYERAAYEKAVVGIEGDA